MRPRPTTRQPWPARGLLLLLVLWWTVPTSVVAIQYAGGISAAAGPHLPQDLSLGFRMLAVLLVFCWWLVLAIRPTSQPRKP